MADGSLIVGVDLDDKPAQKKLEDLTKKINGLEKSITDMKTDKAPLERLFARLSGELDEAKSKLQEMKDSGMSGRSSQMKAQVAEVKELQQYWNSIYWQVEQYDKAIAKAEKDLASAQSKMGTVEKAAAKESAKAQEMQEKADAEAAEAARLKAIADSATVADQRVVELRQEMEQLKAAKADMEAAGVGFGYQEYDEAAARIQELNAELKEYANSVTGEGPGNQIGNDAEQGATRAERAMNRIKSAFKSAMSACVSAGKTFATKVLPQLATLPLKAAKGFLGMGNGAKSAGVSLGASLKTLLKYSLGIRSLYALVKKLRTALVDGFKNLAQYSTSVNGSISSVMSALTQFKNALATAFAPILSIVAPVLTQLINMLTQVADAIAQLTARLTGQKTYTRAVKVQQDYAASLESSAGAAKDSAKANKEAEKSLAGFDQINQLSTKSSDSGSSGGGSGGGGGLSPSDMFETVAIEPLDFSSWGEAFSAALDDILVNGIPKLEKGLSDFATWFNGLTAKVYEMFTFPGVQEKVSRLGAELAQALNGFVNQIDWNMLGQALGAGLNTALGFLVSFIYTFDWQNLGNSVATMINGAVGEINWENVGKLLFAKFKIAIEFLAGLLLGLDMKQLATAASDIVKGFYDSATETIQSIDWAQIARQIITFIVNVDWAGMMTSAAGALGSLAGAVASFVGQAIKDAFTGIESYFEGKIEECGGNVVAGILKGIVDGVVGIGQWIYNNIFKPFIDGFKATFGIHSPSTVMQEQGNYLIEGLKQGVVDRIESVVETFKGLWDKIKEVFSNITGWFKDKFSAAWQAVKDVFSKGGEVFSGIKEGILNSLKSVINKLIDGINKVISIPFKGINDSLLKIKSIDILGAKPFNFIGTISVPQIPKLAQGAVIPPNREFMAVLGDQTRGTNIETPEALLRQVFREEMSSTNSPIVELLKGILECERKGQTLYVGQTAFAKMVYNANASEGRRRGLALTTGGAR